MLIMPIIMALENEQDRNKIMEIYSKYYSTMMYVAKSILTDYALAEDAVSESVIKIIHHLDKISNVSCHSTRGYIVSIVENTAKDIIKKRNNHKEDYDDEIDDTPDGDISVLGRLTNDEGCDIIIKAILSLPNTLAYVLYLSAVKGYSNKEISEMLDISYDLTRQRLSRARKAVKKTLEGEGYGR